MLLYSGAVCALRLSNTETSQLLFQLHDALLQQLHLLLQPWVAVVRHHAQRWAAELL
jgi:hypothetical protein